MRLTRKNRESPTEVGVGKFWTSMPALRDAVKQDCNDLGVLYAALLIAKFKGHCGDPASTPTPPPPKDGNVSNHLNYLRKGISTGRRTAFLIINLLSS